MTRGKTASKRHPENYLFRLPTLRLRVFSNEQRNTMEPSSPLHRCFTSYRQQPFWKEEFPSFSKSLCLQTSPVRRNSIEQPGKAAPRFFLDIPTGGGHLFANCVAGSQLE